jgi:hypothetical protein
MPLAPDEACVHPASTPEAKNPTKAAARRGDSIGHKKVEVHDSLDHFALSAIRTANVPFR